jgi:hypothetical protein
MQYTLLEIVQDILNDMDSDEVNSIDDTIESRQIAQIVQSCYFEMIANRNWPHLKKLIQLEAAGSTSKPNYLRIPVNTKELLSVKYQKQKQDSSSVFFEDVVYKEPEAFLDIVSRRNSGDAKVSVIKDFGGSDLFIINNKAPSYWTTFDDLYIVTDSWDSAIDDTLKKSKTQAIAYINPKWVKTNEAIPNLPVEALPALLEEAKSTAFFTLKQMANQKAEQKAARQQRWLSRKAWRVTGGITYPDYGRKTK